MSERRRQSYPRASFSFSSDHPRRRPTPFPKHLSPSLPLSLRLAASGPKPDFPAAGSASLSARFPAHAAGCDCYGDEKRCCASYCMNHRANHPSRSLAPINPCRSPSWTAATAVKHGMRRGRRRGRDGDGADISAPAGPDNHSRARDSCLVFHLSLFTNLIVCRTAW